MLPDRRTFLRALVAATPVLRGVVPAERLAATHPLMVAYDRWVAGRQLVVGATPLRALRSAGR